jgi:hypothetical protein
MKDVMKKIYYLIITLIIIQSCKKPYNPPAIASPGSYLVVEGVINAGADSTIIKLSRTVNPSSGTTDNPETGAVVSVQSSTNATYPLVETSPGNYSVPGLNLDVTKNYRISIKTSSSQQYLSDLVPVNVTPPIDSVGYTVQSNGIQLYLNTHDPNNNTHYYRWDYAETWQFHSKYQSDYITNGVQIVPRTLAQQVYSCFGNNVSSTILLGSSAKLSQDVIYQSPLTSVVSTSEKLETKYSIQVKQYALTSDAFNFYTNLKKNTEQLGSIFDAEPSEIAGNIHNVSNANEPVVGYISACTIQSKRIFIANSQLPQSWFATYPYDCGPLDSNWFAEPNTSPPVNMVAYYLIPLNSGNIPVQAFYQKGGPGVAGYLSSDPECVDCTLRGTTTPPSFWK